jgi:hypothetical protein
VANYSEPLPVEAIRDLLGITRALYAAAKAEGAGERRLAELEAAGKDLKLAIGMARKNSAGSLGHRRAWELAEQGYERLLEAVNVTTALLPTIEAAAARARVRIPLAVGDREEERRAQRTRR